MGVGRSHDLALPKPTASRTTPGKSEIKRRYTVEHQFRNPGAFKVSIRLKKGTKVIAQATAQLQVRPGLGYPGQ